MVSTEAEQTLIEVTGEDGRDFLQGQLTQNLESLTRLPALPAAHCLPNGRVFATMTLVGLGGPVGLVVPAAMREPLIERLARFRLRAKVGFDFAGDAWTVAAVERSALDGSPAAGTAAPVRIGDAVVWPLPGTDCLELVAPAGALEALGIGEAALLGGTEHRSARIAAGHADVLPATAERFTAQMLNLDAIGAIDFVKGCYSGQEVIARTHNRGRVKRRLARFEDGARAAAAVPSEEVFGEDGGVAGTVVNAANGQLLAVVPLAADALRRADGGALRRLPLPYPTPEAVPGRHPQDTPQDDP